MNEDSVLIIVFNNLIDNINNAIIDINQTLSSTNFLVTFYKKEIKVIASNIFTQLF